MIARESSVLRGTMRDSLAAIRLGLTEALQVAIVNMLSMRQAQR
jgi:hypothetical protein